MTEAEDGSVLILAPRGRDGAVAAAILGEVEIDASTCSDVEDLVARLEVSACAVVTEEALLSADRRSLAAWIEAQPTWSDFPFVLLIHRGGSPVEHLTTLLGNVTVLERPFHPAVLANAVRSALRARGRQREVEAYLEERQRTHERQGLLIRELHHRVKNTLATVQGLLGATARSTRSVQEFYHSFSNRIVSLANTHNLLTEDYWQTAPLIEMFRNELSHYDDGATRRVTLDGPSVELSADLAVPVGMAVHELTTNAAKYGALSVPGGRIAIAWQVRDLPAERRLEIEWLERGGPLVKPPSRKGFGSTLLDRVLTQQCRAAISIAYDPEGVSCQIGIPLVAERLVPEY